MNFKELSEIKEKSFKQIALRFGKKDNQFEKEVCICSETGCLSSNSQLVYEEFASQIKLQNLSDKFKISKVGCFGYCSQGPIVVIYPEGVFYTKVQQCDVEEIISKHLLNDEIVDRLLCDSKSIKPKIQAEVDYYKKQKKLVSATSQFINAENIEEYIALDGYFALYKALTMYSSSQVIDEIKKSGLRGRGGAGFPTGQKWQFAYDYKADQKYVVCNGDEGDPGAFMDRSVMEGNPHAILEAMAIEGYAINATKGVIYVRAEYPLATKRLSHAIQEAKEYGLLGNNIFDTNFNFEIEIRLGAGAFVCGEETALLNSVEGKRGEPRLKPPYPAEKGLYQCPTVVNNVETLANIPYIILNGSDLYAKIGIENNRGTKIFALSGKVKNTGLVEVELGTKLKTLIFDIGGGIQNDKKFKAAQMGGPSGGCLSEKDLDVSIDYESLISHGSMMGSGGVVVMDEDTCMVDIAKFFLQFTCDESCGKCTPCRIGNKRILEILEKITNGNGEMEDLDKLEKLCNYVKANSLCGLGQSSPNPVLSTLKNFRDEYVEHIKNKHCPANVCKNLTRYEITDKCVGCSACSLVCPTKAISGEIKSKFNIDQEKCIKCAQCFNTCRFNAIKRG